MTTQTVLVAGAGLVGLTMACELARFGVPVRIAGKAAARSDKSKALAVWPRTLELLDRAGCADAFASAGLEARAADMFAGSNLIAHVPFSGLASAFKYLLTIRARRARPCEGRPARHLQRRGAWLVRPDGFVAAVVTASEVAIVDACLSRIAS